MNVGTNIAASVHWCEFNETGLFSQVRRLTKFRGKKNKEKN